MVWKWIWRQSTEDFRTLNLMTCFVILVIFQTRYFQGQHKGSPWLSLQRNSVRKFALLQKDYFCWTIFHFDVFTKRIPTQGFAGRLIFLAVLLILKSCQLAGSMEGAPVATTRSQFQNMFHLHAISNKCRAHDDIMLARLSFSRYMRLPKKLPSNIKPKCPMVIEMLLMQKTSSNWTVPRNRFEDQSTIKKYYHHP